MGMILGFFLLIYIAIAVGIYLFIKHYINMKWVNRITLAILILIPTYDIIVTNILGAYYCNAEPNPKTFIKEKVEYPESIYWEDNVYPGFSAEDRKLMIINYLDGKHLKKMALNGDDGKTYVYEAKEGDFKSINYDKKYINIYEQYAQYIIGKSKKVYTKETMPKMNYTVTFNEIPLPPFARKFLYSDETKIIDNATQETIAYNRRYMRFFYNIAPDLTQGDIYYVPEPICGERMEHLEYELFDAYKWSEIHLGTHARNLNEILIKRNLKGKK